MIPEQKKEILEQSDVEIMARTIYGEARGQGLEGMVAVASVILNRTLSPAKYGYEISGVCLKPMQFSCWNDEDPNLPILMKPPSGDLVFTTARIVANLAKKGLLRDNTGGANLYHSARMVDFPRWASATGVVWKKQIGNHIFYQEV